LNILKTFVHEMSQMTRMCFSNNYARVDRENIKMICIDDYELISFIIIYLYPFSVLPVEAPWLLPKTHKGHPPRILYYCGKYIQKHLVNYSKNIHNSLCRSLQDIVCKT
jgi:hypothetical protein